MPILPLPLLARTAPRRPRTSGIALVIVLAFVALATGLIIAFFTSATTEYTSAKSASDASSAKQLADSAVQAAMGSVREATTLQISAGTGTASAPWASQPGMIRTYDPTTGTPLKYYKLYSSDTMVVNTPAAAYDSSSDVDPAWDTKPSLYADLNSPVTNTDGTTNFPIVDPTAQSTNPNTAVQGFDYSTYAPTNPGNKIDGVVPVNSVTSTAPQRLPMPVKWLYVLADGSLHSATAGATGTAVTINPSTVSGSSVAATTTNPIVGRIAYWTDDETCKVNLNTASEAQNSLTETNPNASDWKISFWDTPHFDTPIEQNLGKSQPANGEFQRYPGHPASVALNGIFPLLTSTSILKSAATGPHIAPRYAYGGSKDGTNPWLTSSAITNLPFDRLYASLDDVIFDPMRNSDNGNAPLLSKAQVNASRFFTTTTSRASELNLFGLPRIAVWPINTNTATGYQSASDQLIAFCSTVTPPSTTANPNPSAYPFYFTRTNANHFLGTGTTTSPDDIHLPRNVQLLQYLDALTSKNVPVVNASFATKYAGNSVSAFGTEKGQILTEIFDYIRGADTGDNSVLYPYGVQAGGYNPSGGYNWGAGQVTPTTVLSTDGALPPSMRDSQGFGARFYRLTEAGLQFSVLAQGQSSPGASATSNGYALPTGQAGAQSGVNGPWVTMADPITKIVGTYPPAGFSGVQAYLALGFLNLSPGTVGGMPTSSGNPASSAVASSFHEAFYVEVLNLDQLQLSAPGGAAQPMGFPSSAKVIMGPDNYAGGISGGLQRGSGLCFMGPAGMMTNRTLSRAAFDPSNPTNKIFPFFSDLLTIPYGASPTSMTTMAISMNDATKPITVNIYSCASSLTKGYPDQGQLVQTITLNFVPNGTSSTFAAPLVDSSGTGSVDGGFFPGGAQYSGIGTGSAKDRWSNIGIPQEFMKSNAVLQAKDVVRSLVLDDRYTRGDARMLARPTIPSTYFIPHELTPRTTATLTSTNGSRIDYYDTTHLRAESFRDGGGQVYTDDASPNQFGVLGGGLWSSSAAYTAPAAPRYLSGGAVITPLSVMGSLPVPSTIPGDWDNGISNLADGPWINQPDEGNTETNAAVASDIPYFDITQNNFSAAFFSPNRMMPSPAMLGSLSTGVKRLLPWQTLLFRPGPTGHPGNPASPVALGGTDPADHYLLDLFWMPSVEPYAISEPFATAGKINLNQQIVPFTYITRNTGLVAAMAAERIGVMPSSEASNYKTGFSNTPQSQIVSRVPLNLLPTSDPNGIFGVNVDSGSTLRGFNAKFASGDIFRSASQVCEMYLVPGGTTGVSWKTDNQAQQQWYQTTNFALVGDNVRERPYADIYNKVTTKSNTYTVHYCAQSLRKSIRNSDPTSFDTAQGDQVVGEQRGATTFERYLDSSNITSDPGTSYLSLDPYYRLRVQSTRVFTP